MTFSPAPAVNAAINAIANPHREADNNGDRETLLAELDHAETEVAAIRDQLKAILAEALVR